MSSSENQIFELSKMMASFNFLQGKKVTYGQLERFLKKQFKSGPLLVLSKANDLKFNNLQEQIDSTRFVWNKRTYGGHYKKETIDEVIGEIFSNNDLSKLSSLEKEVENKKFIYFQSGENSKQTFYILFELESPLEEKVISLFINFVRNISKGWSRLDELKKIENLVHVDDVTGLYNQRKLLKDLDLAIERFRELEERFSLLFIDIDHFKKVNDGHGHLVGTQLLSSLGSVLKDTLRESDLIYRYGGDEFVMVIPDVGADMGKIIGERVLNAVKLKHFEIDALSTSGGESHFDLTVSIGVATFPNDANSREEILNIADRMMYEAKKTGRGRVCYTAELLTNSSKTSKGNIE